mgnify:CR=1 FL=1
MSDSKPVIEIRNLHKSYGTLEVLKGVDITAPAGHVVSMIGSSGSGKSTLIRFINRLEEHQEGDIEVTGVKLDENLKNVDKVRSEVGMVFQSFNLFPHLTVLQNCALSPHWVQKMAKSEAEKLAMEYLNRVHIPEQADKYPGQLSGGQQQRVAIARALFNSPRLILADEPTSALDQKNRKAFMEILMDLCDAYQSTLIFVSHDPTLASDFDRIDVLGDINKAGA